ncbi:MAG TPA: D-Ala-D-Ala carboxypeptidase family metallohydrolase [Thermoanaerobaculia bacterium]|nr:D-Ala-D-Ala carboxypeptidase family metallohydrolase [Thermoanaerobaculia bacterium]
MTRSLVKLFSAVLLLSAPAVFAGTRPGTRVHLDAVPEYVERLFVPVVPQTENTLSIGNLPAEEVIQVPAGFDVRVKNGAIVAYSDESGDAGYATVRAGGRELTLTLVSVVPYGAMKNGRVDGYRVGEYQSQPLKGLEQYERPKGFIRLSNENEALRVSDHYKMQDFQCKLDGTTKFLILRTEALVKLEILQHELETQHGVEFNRFTIMSGYRTPYYNSRIGNETSYSRHLYGDAMDIFIDDNGDGSMDDVNRDGRIDTSDARFLLRVAETIDNSTEWGWLKGGAGVYEANAAHGPYLHVDARGYVTRWGKVDEPKGALGMLTAAR